MAKLLKTRFLKFEKKQLLERLPKNSRINIEILNYLNDSRNEKTLLEGLKSIFDQICNVKAQQAQEEEKDSKNNNNNKKRRKNKTNQNKKQGERESEQKEEKRDGKAVTSTRQNDETIDLLSQKKVEKALKFHEQFELYFSRLCDKVSKIKCELKTFLCVLLFEIGVFNCIRRDKTKETIIPFAQKCGKLNLIELCICDDFGQTLFHFSAGLDNTDLLNVLLTVDGDLTKYTNKLGKSAADEALKHGQWSVVEYDVFIWRNIRYLVFMCVVWVFAFCLFFCRLNKLHCQEWVPK